MSSSCEPGLTAYRGSSNNALVGSFFIFSRSTTSPLHHHPVASSARTKTRALSLFTQFSSFYKYDVASQRQNVAFRASCHAWNSLRHPHWHGGPMSKGGYLGHAALAVASSIVLAACSSDTPTGPPTASQSLMQAAPTIALSVGQGSNSPSLPGVMVELWFVASAGTPVDTCPSATLGVGLSTGHPPRALPGSRNRRDMAPPPLP